jgi:RNA polymerase sigma-70 factor (ECF subfamily)
MIRYQAADATAAAVLAEQITGKLYRFFASQVRNHHEAEDLLQDCWLRIHKARHTYRPGEPVLPWIYAIARRAQIDHYRKRQRIARHEFQKEDVQEIAIGKPSFSPQSPLPTVSELLNTLPPQQRQTILLLKVAGMSLEEVSKATGASVGAVKQRAHRAYMTLRRLFGGQNELP